MPAPIPRQRAIPAAESGQAPAAPTIGDTSGATPGDTPRDTSGATSGVTPGAASGDTSRATSGATPGAASAETPGATTGETSGATPGTTTGKTSGVASGETAAGASGGTGALRDGAPRTQDTAHDGTVTSADIATAAHAEDTAGTADAAHRAAHGTHGIHSTPPGHLTLLMIEDDPGGSPIVPELLDPTGKPIRVRTARNLTEAERLLTDDVHCILLDLALPAPGRAADGADDELA
ncbi:hypothetical protein R6V09_45355, partial [Streptomyces sp. W16]|nr:hypothetical protein [Streptomyces sp. W16]